MNIFLGNHIQDTVKNNLECFLSFPFHLVRLIYIYIYNIITALVVTKSLCRFVSNQVQYNMESAQYLGLSCYAMMMFCSLAIVTYIYRNKIM